MSMCMWIQDQNALGECKNHPQARFDMEAIDPDIPHPSTRSWVRYEDGHVAILGSDVDDADSQEN